MVKLIPTEVMPPNRKSPRSWGFSFLPRLDQNLAHKLFRLPQAHSTWSLSFFLYTSSACEVPLRVSLCLWWEDTQTPSKGASGCPTHGPRFLEVDSCVWTSQSTLGPCACQTTRNKSPLSPAVISTCLEAWNLISTLFISAASLRLLLQVIKFTESLPSDCVTLM